MKFDKLQTMGEAKSAIKFLFSIGVKMYKDKVQEMNQEMMQTQNKLQEVQSSLDDVS